MHTRRGNNERHRSAPQEQERAITEHLKDAAKAGADQVDLRHYYRLLQTASRNLATRAPTTFATLPISYFRAFDCGRSDQTTELKLTKRFLTQSKDLLGFESSLQSALDYFTDLLHRNRDAARHFGLAVLRTHPLTTPTTKAASASA